MAFDGHVTMFGNANSHNFILMMIMMIMRRRRRIRMFTFFIMNNIIMILMMVSTYERDYDEQSRMVVTPLLMATAHRSIFSSNTQSTSSH